MHRAEFCTIIHPKMALLLVLVILVPFYKIILELLLKVFAQKYQGLHMKFIKQKQNCIPEMKFK